MTKTSTFCRQKSSCLEILQNSFKGYFYFLDYLKNMDLYCFSSQTQTASNQYCTKKTWEQKKYHVCVAENTNEKFLDMHLLCTWSHLPVRTSWGRIFGSFIIKSKNQLDIFFKKPKPCPFSLYFMYTIWISIFSKKSHYLLQEKTEKGAILHKIWSYFLCEENPLSMP